MDFPKREPNRRGRLKTIAAGLVVLAALSFAVLKAISGLSSDAEVAAVCEVDCEPSVVRAAVVGTNRVEVTFNGKLEPFVPDDLQLVAPTGAWSELAPKLNRYLTVTGTEVKTNSSRQTVAIYEVKETLNPDGTLAGANSRDPSGVKTLAGSYYSGVREKDAALADSLITWQLDHGGWYKNMGAAYAKPWDGRQSRTELLTRTGEEIGTIDNGATTAEIVFLSILHDETRDERYKQSVRKAIQFLLTMQAPSGGWPQVYPARGNYSDNITYNDFAMTRVMEVLALVAEGRYPFDSGIVDDKLRGQVRQAVDRGLDYMLKSQIKVEGERTAWGAQHDPVTYEPVGGRPYEHPSISSAESAAVVKYLMSVPNPTREVAEAVQSALDWLERARVKGMRYETKTPSGSAFVPSPDSSTWYRFYEIGTNLPIFSGRDGIIKRSLEDIEEERRNGYAWGGDWPLKLLQVASTIGYYESRVYVRTMGAGSRNEAGHSLSPGRLVRVEGSESAGAAG